MFDNYYNAEHSLKPYTVSFESIPGSAAPARNAVREVEKPTIEKGFWPCRSGEEWVYTEDHRGEKGYNKEGIPDEIKELGPYPEGWQKELPLLSLEEARAKAFEALRLRKWQAKDAGLTVNGIMIDTDDKGQATINGAVTNVLIDPAFTATWKTAATDEQGAAVWVELDGPTILGLAKALTSYTESCFAVEAQKQAELATLTTSEQITTWLETKLAQGWPSQEITI